MCNNNIFRKIVLSISIVLFVLSICFVGFYCFNSTDTVFAAIGNPTYVYRQNYIRNEFMTFDDPSTWVLYYNAKFVPSNRTSLFNMNIETGNLGSQDRRFMSYKIGENELELFRDSKPSYFLLSFVNGSSLIERIDATASESTTNNRVTLGTLNITDTVTAVSSGDLITVFDAKNTNYTDFQLDFYAKTTGYWTFAFESIYLGYGNTYFPNIDYFIGRNDFAEYENAFNAGFSAGKDEGYNNGYNIGYNKGVADSNDYSFFSLMSAVIDSPIKAVMSAFDFELLGVNMRSFLYSLLTIAAVLLIVKLVLRGGS